MRKNDLPSELALGFRIKSGWAATVLLAGPANSLQILDCRRLDLADPAVPRSSQPYHAAMGKLQTDQTKIEKLQGVVFRQAKESFSRLLREYAKDGYRPFIAGILVGSETDPARITNPHIRAHALEGQLFRTAVVRELESAQLPYSVFLERTLYARAGASLSQSEEQLKRALTTLGRDLDVPWRADQKAACLAAWLSLGVRRLGEGSGVGVGMSQTLERDD
jgi:hypothetical protein